MTEEQKADKKLGIGTLHIENVDLPLLERQRLALASIDRPAWLAGFYTGTTHLDQEQIDALDGIQTLLDSWSDSRQEDLYLDKTDTWRHKCGCSEAVRLDGGCPHEQTQDKQLQNYKRILAELVGMLEHCRLSNGVSHDGVEEAEQAAKPILEQARHLLADTEHPDAITFSLSDVKSRLRELGELNQGQISIQGLEKVVELLKHDKQAQVDRRMYIVLQFNVRTKDGVPMEDAKDLIITDGLLHKGSDWWHQSGYHMSGECFELNKDIEGLHHNNGKPCLYDEAAFSFDLNPRFNKSE